MGTNKIKYSLVYNRKKNLSLDGKALIQIRAYQNGKSKYFSTNIFVQPEYWDEKNKRVKHSHALQFDYNRIIRNQLEAIEVYELRMIQRQGYCTLDSLKSYEKVKSEQKVISFTKYFENYIEQSLLKHSSLKMYKQTFNKLNEFRKLIYFEELSYSFLIEFDRFLLKSGLNINTVKKHHHRLKAIINKAIKEDIIKIDANPYKKFTPKSAEPERPFLSIEELARIEALTFGEQCQHLERVRDLFLLSAYTGLRFSDVRNLTGLNFYKTSNGLKLHFKAQKTGKILDLPLYRLFRLPDAEKSRPELIVEKYLIKDEAFSETPLFQITNQYYNRTLKLIAQRARIRKNITSHVARRTFATILGTKVNSPVLQKLLQHSRPDMTNIYIQLSNHAIEQELEKIQW